MEYLMTCSKVVEFVWEVPLRKALDVYDGTADVECSSQSPWPKIIVAEVSCCVFIGIESEVYHRIYTADSKNYKEGASEPFKFCSGVLVNHQKCESSQGWNRDKPEKEELETADFFASEDVIVNWINAAHYEEADAAVIVFQEAIHGDKTMGLKEVEDRRESETDEGWT